MNVLSFNTNSIRMREHQLGSLTQKHAPDVTDIQEIKAQDSGFPLVMIASPGKNAGYQAAFYGQKTHYQDALTHRDTPLETRRSPAQDSDHCLIRAEFKL